MDNTESVTTVADDKVTYQRSTIKFPYGTIGDAVRVATAIHHKYGRSCTQDQLAAELGHDSVNSGTFRLRLATARLFGVISKGRTKIELTGFGQSIVDSATQETAKAEAFLRIPLYKRIFEEYQGKALPGDNGLEALMEELGVTPKQTGRARQAFQRSADQAGYFHTGKSRLVAPPLDPLTEIEIPSSEFGEPPLPKPDITFEDPLVEGLFKKLPKLGQKFPESEQEEWLDLAKLILKSVWRNQGQIGATVHGK